MSGGLRVGMPLLCSALHCFWAFYPESDSDMAFSASPVLLPPLNWSIRGSARTVLYGIPIEEGS